MKNIILASVIYFLICILLVIFTYMRAYVTRDYAKNDKWTRENLNNVIAGIDYYYYTNQKLPSSLYQIIDENQFYTESVIDNKPAGKKFDYESTGEKTFKLCIEFLTTHKPDEKLINNEQQYYGRSTRWIDFRHRVGVNCYNLDLSNPNLLY